VGSSGWDESKKKGPVIIKKERGLCNPQRGIKKPSEEHWGGNVRIREAKPPGKKSRTGGNRHRPYHNYVSKKKYGHLQGWV